MLAENFKYYFEDYCFDTESGQLLKNGTPVSLSTKALSVLLILIQKSGRFVRKEEIFESVWAESFVEEANLTQQIYLIRKAIGQNRNRQPFIETMPKRGYRLNAIVSTVMSKTPEKTPVIIEDTNESHADPDANPVKLPSKRIMSYEFDDFRLDLQRRMLYKVGQPITLAAKVFDTLVCLVEHSGELIKKDQLMDSIWQERFVEENNLTQKIFILRQVLGDNKKEHQYIVTVPGEGYTFVAPVTMRFNGPPAGNGDHDLTASPQTLTATATLAVLPFRCLTENSDGQNDFWGIGLADALISQLSRYNELIVRPILSVIEFQNRDWQPAPIGWRMQVSHLIEGIIQCSGSKLKISVKLLETETGRVIWAEDFTCDNVDFLETQDAVSNRVSKAVAAKLNLVPLPAKDVSPKSFEAFQEYIKGKFHWNGRTVGGLKKGIEHAQNALAIEPMYAMAYVGLADCYNLLAGQHSFMSPKDAFPKARAASQTALELSGEDMAEAYASLAFTTFYFDWDRPLAAQYFQRAIELKPNYPSSHHWYGEALAAERHFDESIEELRKAQELDPLSPAISADLAQTLFFAGRVDESRSLLDHILDINPRFVRALYLYGLLYEESGEYGKAVDILRRAVQLAPEEPTIIAELACARAYAGDVRGCQQLLRDLKRIGERRYLSEFLMAMTDLALNQTDKFFERLERSLEDRDIWLVWIDVLPKLNPLRLDPRFISFAAKIRQSLMSGRKINREVETNNETKSIHAQ